jgi:hypothetical protein
MRPWVQSSALQKKKERKYYVEHAFTTPELLGIRVWQKCTLCWFFELNGSPSSLLVSFLSK